MNRTRSMQWLLVPGVLGLLLIPAATAQAGGLVDTISAPDKVEPCADAVTYLEKWYQSTKKGSTHQPLAVSYCNVGAYTVKSSKVIVYRLEDGGWWNEIYNEKIGANITLGYGVYWRGLVLQKNESYKVKLVFNIASGDKESCTKKLDSPTVGMLWEVVSTGTTSQRNRCRTQEYRH